MPCKHLQPLESAILAQGIEETFRGQAWSDNCREWVYFNCLLNVEAIKQGWQLAACVKISGNDDPRSGCELGFYCMECQDGIMGMHPAHAKSGAVLFPG